jgi:hypothetical protein
MSITTVKTNLAALERNISGITRAYAYAPPGVLPDSDMPMFCNYARAANYSELQGSDTELITRRYLLRLYVKAITEGTRVADGSVEGENLVAPLIDATWAYFTARPQLGLTAPVMRARLLSDSGTIVLAGSDGNYWGCEFEIEVSEYNIRQYADNE